MKVISDKKIRVATLGGAVVTLEPGVERTVADEIGVLLLSEGARQVSDTAPKVETVVIDEVVEVTEDGTDVMEVIERLVEIGDPKDFKADGSPKAAALNKLAGRVIPTDEREAAWEEYLNS